MIKITPSVNSTLNNKKYNNYNNNTAVKDKFSLESSSGKINKLDFALSK